MTTFNISDTALCSCGSNIQFKQCCKPLIEGTAAALSPEQLMRSRYTAFALKCYDYIKQTHKSALSPITTAAELAKEFEGIYWCHLNVLSHSKTDDIGEVKFQAFYAANRKLYVLEETSCFVRENAVWLYDADASKSEITKLKISRNDNCFCGSGKKYKKCCDSRIARAT